MKDYYKKMITLALENINDDQFLKRVWILLRLHIQKKGESA